MVFRTLLLTAATGVVLMAPSPGAAQGSGDGFLFRTPRIQLGVRGGLALATAGSEIFDFTRDELTVDKSDFNGGSFGIDVAFRASERLDVVVGFMASGSTTRSEFRDWVGEDDLPIEQETSFRRRPFTVSARYFLNDRGRSISRFAWIPNRITPYVGGGVGAMWYEFAQEGEFVDYEDLGIFNTRFESTGWSAMAHVGGGFEMSLSPRALLNLDGRYEFASTGLSQDFVDFDDIDLSGFQVSLGLALRF